MLKAERSESKLHKDFTQELVFFRDTGDVVSLKMVVVDFQMLDVGNSSLNLSSSYYSVVKKGQIDYKSRVLWQREVIYEFDYVEVRGVPVKNKSVYSRCSCYKLVYG